MKPRRTHLLPTRSLAPANVPDSRRHLSNPLPGGLPPKAYRASNAWEGANAGAREPFASRQVRGETHSTRAWLELS